MTVHFRRRENSKQRSGEAESECLRSIDAYKQAVQRVRNELLEKRGQYARTVIVTTDETDAVVLAKLSKLCVIYRTLSTSVADDGAADGYLSTTQGFRQWRSITIHGGQSYLIPCARCSPLRSICADRVAGHTFTWFSVCRNRKVDDVDACCEAGCHVVRESCSAVAATDALRRNDGPVELVK